MCGSVVALKITCCRGRGIVVLVNVDERLVDRVVREEVRIDGQCTGMLIGNAVHQPQCELLFHRQKHSPRDRERPIRAERNTRREHVEDPLPFARQELRIEHALRRRDVELVGDVDHMDGEGAFDIAAAESDIEIAEWRRMSRGAARAQKNNRCNGGPEGPGVHRAELYG